MEVVVVVMEVILRTAVEGVYPGESGQAVSTKGFHPLRVSSSAEPFPPSLSLSLFCLSLLSLLFFSLSLSLLSKPFCSRSSSTRPALPLVHQGESSLISQGTKRNSDPKIEKNHQPARCPTSSEGSKMKSGCVFVCVCVCVCPVHRWLCVYVCVCVCVCGSERACA